MFITVVVKNIEDPTCFSTQLISKKLTMQVNNWISDYFYEISDLKTVKNFPECPCKLCLIKQEVMELRQIFCKHRLQDERRVKT